MKALCEESDSSEYLSIGSPVFITDEIPMPYKSRKVVCDILALRIEGKETVPVLIELKSSRKMKELVRQLEDYVEIMKCYQQQFEQLYSALLGKKMSFSAEPEKWIVWPAVKKDMPFKLDRREKELAQKNIGVIQYIYDNGCFSFHVGHRPT